MGSKCSENRIREKTGEGFVFRDIPVDSSIFFFKRGKQHGNMSSSLSLMAQPVTLRLPVTHKSQ